MPQKNRSLIITGVSFVLMAVLFYVFRSYLILPIKKEQEKEAVTLSEMKQKLRIANERAGQLNQIQLEMAGLQIDVAQLEKQLPKNRELPSLIRILTHRAEANGLSILAITPNRPVSKGLYEEIAYNVAVSASYHNLARFLTAMGKGERLFAARNISLMPNNNKADPGKTVNATMMLIAFKYHE